MTVRQKILVVDDKAANLFSLELILKETGIEIIRAESGNEALVASINHDFALALLDVQMPVMDGYELATLLRGEEKTQDLPIIFVSAVYSSDYHVFKGFDAGAVDFVSKPFNPDVLLCKVKVFLKLDLQKRQLEEVGEALKKTNDSLEILVHERTCELEAVVAELRYEVEKRKRAEKEILQAKREWQEIFEAIGHMTMILDKDHTIIEANRATLQQTGLSKEEIVGQMCCTVFHNSDSPMKDCPMTAMLVNGEMEITEAEVEALGKNYIVSCTPMYDRDGELNKIIHIATDITKRKQLKKELIQAHKMEAIGSLASGIAHDFNNILTAVLGFTELSLNNVEEKSELENDLKHVLAAGNRAKDLVRQILNFARKTDEEPKPVQVSLVVKEVIKFLRSTIPASIEIKEKITSNSLILANPIKIHQLVMNLCSNAAHAMNESGSLTVSLRDVILGTDELPLYKQMSVGRYLQLEIEDTGSGIPEEIIDSIFHPFYTTKGIDEGTGMGLAMVNSIVKEYCGDISVSSEVGKGTVFSIILPITEIADVIDVLEKGQKLPGGTERILLVDDEAVICKLIFRMLNGYGYKVSTETDSEKALACITEQPGLFDLIITDMTMPRMSGDELTKKILALRSDLPVIIATGFSKRLSDPQAIELGAKAFLKKPFDKIQLLRTIREVLDNTGKNTDEELGVM